MFEFTDDVETMLETFSMDDYDDVFELTESAAKYEASRIHAKYDMKIKKLVYEGDALRIAGKRKQAKEKYSQALKLAKEGAEDAKFIPDNSVTFTVIAVLFTPFIVWIPALAVAASDLSGQTGEPYSPTRHIRLKNAKEYNQMVRKIENEINKL